MQRFGLACYVEMIPHTQELGGFSSNLIVGGRK
jgi:hypothetical protein